MTRPQLCESLSFLNPISIRVREFLRYPDDANGKAMLPPQLQYICQVPREQIDILDVR